ncbi:MAG: hypothetical protein AAFN08_00045 [Cyanobacteria bacterium J06559_3]
MTTEAVGEEGGNDPVTTLAIGEGGDDLVTTLAIGEEGGGHLPNISTGVGNQQPFGGQQHIFGGEEAPLGDRLERLFELADSIFAGDIQIKGL